VQLICILFSWCHCHPIISCSSKIQNGLPMWCQLTRIVLEKRLINGCSCSSMAHWCGNCRSGWNSVVMEVPIQMAWLEVRDYCVQRQNRSPPPKKTELFPWNSIFWWILSGIFVHAITMHCNASNLVLEISKHDKTCGTVCINIPRSRFCGVLVRMIYAHDCGMYVMKDRCLKCDGFEMLFHSQCLEKS